MGEYKGSLAVTVDIEDWYHLSPVTGAPFSKYVDVPDFFKKWNGRYDYLTKSTLKVLDLLQELDIRATFFVVADIVEHYPGLVENIADKGHEIACHGLHHACKINPKTKRPLMTKEEFEERTAEAKLILEKAIGQKVIGYRAPNAYIAGWMIDVLEKIGFQYDSSISVNSAYNKSDCILKNIDTRCYYPETGSLMPGNCKRRILEIPWPYFRFIVKFPAGGGPLLRLFGSKYIMYGLRNSLKRGDTIFYFHPLDISYENFPLNTSIKHKLFWLVKGERVMRRIQTILSEIQCSTTTCSDILKTGQFI